MLGCLPSVMYVFDRTSSFLELDLSRSQMPRRSRMSSLRIPVSRKTHLYIYRYILYIYIKRKVKDICANIPVFIFVSVDIECRILIFF